MESSIFHQNLIQEIAKLSGVSQVNELFESPNKYGNIVGNISFRYNVIDKYNYNIGRITIDYTHNSYFIPDLGYKEINSVQESIQALKQHYNLK
jgi:hypothetical protein